MLHANRAPSCTIECIMGNSMEGDRSPDIKGQADGSETAPPGRIQAVLALAVYVVEHKLGIDAASFVNRHDKVASDIKRDAMREWASVQPENGLSRQEVFGQYLESKRKEVMGADLTTNDTCIAFLRTIPEVELHIPDRTA